MSKLAAVMQLPFAEQSAYFKQKLKLPTQTYSDIAREQHDRAFVVAGAMKADLLNDLHAAVQKAIDNGTTLAEFKKDFEAAVAKSGWKGWTGSDTAEGRAWRARVIYETNLRTSHAAGRWQQMRDPDVLKMRPNWQYVHRTLENPRLEHKAWDGLILPADDAWWSVHYPPCGWGCKCTVYARSDADLQRMGKTLDTAPPTTYVGVKVDGRVVSVPKGVDYGWDYAAGSTWHPNLEKYPYALAKQVVAAEMQDGVFKRWLEHIDAEVITELKNDTYAPLKADNKQNEIKKVLRKQLANKEQYPIAVISKEQQAMLGVTTQVIYFSHYDAVKQAYSRMGNTGFDVLAYYDVQHLIDDAVLIVRENDQMTVWLASNNKGYVAVLQQTNTGKGLYLKSFRKGSKKEKEMSRMKSKGVVLFEAKE